MKSWLIVNQPGATKATSPLSSSFIELFKDVPLSHLFPTTGVEDIFKLFLGEVGGIKDVAELFAGEAVEFGVDHNGKIDNFKT